jgi:hypothetical protein
MSEMAGAMTTLRQIGWSTAMVLGLAAVSPAQTVDLSTAPRAVASNGAVVVMPEIEKLDCDGMSNTLRRIDLSNYRDAEPVPRESSDWPIFDYEDKLTKRFYYTCTLGENRLDDPGPAFSFGFETQ